MYVCSLWLCVSAVSCFRISDVNMYIPTMIIKVLNIPLYTCKVRAFIVWYTVRLFWTLSPSSNLLFTRFNRGNLRKVKGLSVVSAKVHSKLYPFFVAFCSNLSQIDHGDLVYDNGGIIGFTLNDTPKPNGTVASYSLISSGFSINTPDSTRICFDVLGIGRALNLRAYQ